MRPPYIGSAVTTADRPGSHSRRTPERVVRVVGRCLARRARRLGWDLDGLELYVEARDDVADYFIRNQIVVHVELRPKGIGRLS